MTVPQVLQLRPGDLPDLGGVAGHGAVPDQAEPAQPPQHHLQQPGRDQAGGGGQVRAHTSCSLHSCCALQGDCPLHLAGAGGRGGGAGHGGAALRRRHAEGDEASALSLHCNLCSVLVQGTAIVDESSLTGESVPVSKSSLPQHPPSLAFHHKVQLLPSQPRTTDCGVCRLTSGTRCAAAPASSRPGAGTRGRWSSGPASPPPRATSSGPSSTPRPWTSSSRRTATSSSRPWPPSRGSA